MESILIKNANIFTPQGSRALKGEVMGALLNIHEGAVLCVDGVITYVGTEESLPSIPDGCKIVDAGGRALIPGFIDSHTHLIFGGYRPDEFEWRLKGDTYMSIMERGGGIQSTVNATRTEDAQSLKCKAQWFLNRMTEMGVTTVEAKSGYGLDRDTELKMLEVIDSLSRDNADRIGVVSTFLGAHAVPSEFKGRTSEYVDFIINEMIPQVKEKAEFFDIFTEKNVFEIEDSRRMLNAAKEAGFKLKLHADEIVTLGGAELAAEVGAFSADHLLHISDDGVKALADKGVVATLLPLTAFALKEPFAPARKLIDAGASVALATDLNPGSCFSGSIPLTIALACIYMRMSIQETLTALTLNAAAAIDRADSLGSIEAGKRADMVILEFEGINSLPYYVGMNCVREVFKNGKSIYKI
jgi:imidazolonepropionase